MRTTVAGDDAALYNCLLMTVQDAAKSSGRKVVIVFSNGPDNASTVPPEEVAELAQSTGTTIYMVSTQQAHLEPISNAVFQRMTAATGGKVYFAKTWKEEQNAFTSIRDDLAHLYSLSYYPQPNPNRGWRTIKVRLVNGQYKNATFVPGMGIDSNILDSLRKIFLPFSRKRALNSLGSCRIWVYEICLSSAAKTIPRGGVFRLEGHAAFHLIDPITMDPIISHPDSDRLKYENCRYNETHQEQRAP